MFISAIRRTGPLVASSGLYMMLHLINRFIGTWTQPCPKAILHTYCHSIQLLLFYTNRKLYNTCNTGCDFGKSLPNKLTKDWILVCYLQRSFLGLFQHRPHFYSIFFQLWVTLSLCIALWENSVSSTLKSLAIVCTHSALTILYFVIFSQCEYITTLTHTIQIVCYAC